MNKRGQGISIQTIVIVILSLLAVVIIAMIMRQQLTKGAQRYEDIGKETELTPGKCQNIILGRGCFSLTGGRPCPEGKQIVPPEVKPWDCPSGQNCCQ